MIYLVSLTVSVSTHRASCRLLSASSSRWDEAPLRMIEQACATGGSCVGVRGRIRGRVTVSVGVRVGVRVRVRVRVKVLSH